MNTIICVGLLVCVSLAYVSATPISDPQYGELDKVEREAKEIFDGQESRWGGRRFGGSRRTWGGGSGWGYGRGWGYGGGGWGYGGGYGGGWGRGGGWGYRW